MDVQPLWIWSEKLFAGYDKEALGPSKSNGAQIWLDTIISHVKHVDGHEELVEEVLAWLNQFVLPVNLSKSMRCAPQRSSVWLAADWAYSHRKRR